MELFLICLVAIGAAINGLWIIAFVRKQQEINEALADYVAADLLKTWEAPAEALIKKLRGENVDNSNP